MACDIEITYKNEKINKNKHIGSEQELDEFLSKNRMLLEKRLGPGRAKIFSYTLPENSVEAIRKMEEQTSRLKSAITWNKTHVGTTNLWRVIGNIGNVSTPIKIYPGSIQLTKEEITKNRKNGVLMPQDIGQVVESLTYSGLFNEPAKNLDYMSVGLQDSFKNLAIENGRKLRTWIIDKYFQKTKDQANFEEQFKNRVRTQVDVSTRDFNSSLREAINTGNFVDYHGNKIDSANIDTIEAKADLVIIDDDGLIHVFDIKTTGLTPGNSLDIQSFVQNHDDYVAQVTTYSEIIRQGPKDNSGNLTNRLSMGKPGIIVLPYIIAPNSDPNNPIRMNSNVSNLVFNPNNIYEIDAKDKYFTYIQSYFWTIPTVTNETMEKVSEFGKEAFPNSRVSEQVKANKATLDFYSNKLIHPIPENTTNKELKEALRKGHKHYFRENLKNGLYVYRTATTQKELIENEYDADGRITKSSPLQKYIDRINSDKALTFNNFSSSLQEAMSKRSIPDLENLIRALAPSNAHRMLHVFKRFISNGWKFKANDVANSNGILIFEKGNNIEIIVVDTGNNINYKSKLALGSSIAGNYIPDSQLTDNRVILENVYGNQMLMKACALVATDPAITSGKKILQISALNFNQSTIYTETGYKLIQSYNMIAREHNKRDPEHRMRMLGYMTFREDTEALIEIANEYLGAIDPSLTISPKRQYQTIEEEIESRIRRLKAENLELTDIRDKGYGTNKWDAFAYLSRALLSAKSIFVSQEEDLGKLFNGIALTGIEASSFNNSSSAIAKQLAEVTSRFFMEARMQFYDEQFEWSKALAEAEEEAGWTGTTGNEWSFFKNWLLLDENGNIDEKFRIRPIDQIRGEKNKKAAELLLRLLAKHRWPDYTEADIQNAIDDERYYELPLVKAGMLEQIWNGNGFRDTVKTAWRRLGTMTNQLVHGKEITEKTREEFEKIDLQKVPDMVWEDESERADKLLDPTSPKYWGVKSCEQNLDFLVLTAIASGIKSETSIRYMPIYTSMLVVCDYMSKIEGMNIQNIRAAVDKYIRSKVFDRDIRDFENKPIAAALGLLKSITASVALAWNTRGLFRESLGGIKKHINRFLSGIENKIDNFGVENIITGDAFEEAYTDVLGNTIDNLGIFSFYNQLNSIYGMVNFSYDEMANESRLHQWTILGIVGDKKMATATAPDFLHRMAILAGHLKTIGAFDAYSLDENGKLKYDMTKDQRFQVWLKYKDNENEIPADKRAQFVKEKQVYENELNDWKKMPSYSYLKYGDMLPQALCNQHILGIKSYADMLYGNYDTETQALIQRQTLGSLFFQYKTYGLAQAAGWFQESKNTNEGLSMHYFYNDKGEKMVKIPKDPTSQFGEWEEKPESEVTEEEWKNGATYLVQLGGLVSQGKLSTDIALLGHLLSLDMKGFNELWNNNPLYRANLLISLLDLFELLIVGLITSLIYNKDKVPIYKQSAFNRWTYGVLMGAAQDGPLFQTIYGITGNGLPPVLGMLQNYVKTANSVIAGNTNILYALTNTFGMTREISNIFRKELQNQK